MDYSEFFATTFDGAEPFDYQRRLAVEPWPSLINVPTGLGKTAAVTLAWLYKRLQCDADTPRRLVYCLPMRVLVEQTCESIRQWLEASRPLFEAQGLSAPSLHVLMGGQTQTEWVNDPEQPAIIVGTQDMLLSRALMRGYGMSRYAWPMHFALLHNDALWVFDEVQLMGPALTTSAQLEGFRRQPSMAPAIPAQSLWLSATLNRDWLNTVDLRPHLDTLQTLALTDPEKAGAPVRKRREAVKHLRPAGTRLKKDHASKSGRKDYGNVLAAEVLANHDEAGDTLVVVNTVERAQAVYDGLVTQGADQPLLIHARFRASERAQIERELGAEPSTSRIIVATQAVEAGVDLTSARLFTELAPWSSLVQRFGRCNRYGEVNEAAVFWVDMDTEDALAPPYETASLDAARQRLKTLNSASPAELPPADEARPVGQVLRRKDFLELFNTEPDLSGFDIDISPYLRDTGSPQLQVFWRDFDAEPGEQAAPRREELCPVSMSQFHEHAGGNKRSAHTWDSLAGEWRPLRRPVPGMTVMLRAAEGGYDPQRGFVAGMKGAVSPVPPETDETAKEASYDGDATSQIGRFVGLTEHLGDVAQDAGALANTLELDEPSRDAIVTAGRWHDLGKAHPAFQNALLDFGPPPAGAETLWAKSSGRGRLRYRTEAGDGEASERPRFRHELASMLAWLEHGDTSEQHDLIAYLIAAHHGKVRLGLRSLPEEKEPPEPERRFARGVWEGDSLPAVRLNGAHVPETTLRLSVMELGTGDQGPSWSERTQRLLAEHGPFRLAWLETLVRIADWRASEREKKS